MLGKLLVFAVLVQVALCRPQSDDEGRIVGGGFVGIDNYPYQVAVQFPDYSQPGVDLISQCGGALIANNVVLTAAHCTDSSPAERAEGKVRVGSSNFWRGEEFRVTQIVDHPQYNARTIDNDVSLLKLDHGVTLGPNVQIIPIASYARQSGVLVKIAGWGMTDPYDEESASSELKAIEYPLIDTNDCRQSVHGRGITNNMICAGLSNGSGTSTCEGDSGGPLVHDGEVVGVVSYGETICAKEHSPDVFADVFVLGPWISRELANLA